MRNKTLMFCAFVAALLCSCNVQKRIVYIQDANSRDVVKMAEDNQIRIKPFDRLTIVVSSKDPELVAPFNSYSSYNSLNGTNVGATTNGAGSLQVRTVTSEGMLDMPIIGTIECAGRTRSQLATEIADKIKKGGYVSDPTVNVQFADMKITVVGEVNRPGQYDIVRDEITLLEALALAGDLTIYGERDSVAVIRETDGKAMVEYVDLRSKDLFASPVYHLCQNDVVYVKPNKYKAATAEINQNRTFWLSLVSSFVGVSSLVVSIVSLTKLK